MRDSCAIFPVDFGFDNKAMRGRSIYTPNPLNGGETVFRNFSMNSVHRPL
jgi:hypothetical protein